MAAIDVMPSRSAANLYRLRGHQIVEVWIFQVNQYQVDDVSADPIDG
jgi:hypothetical protein